MKLLVFAVYDGATAIYGHPHFMVTAAAAIRSFEAALSDPKSDMAKFAKDYSLFQLGSYDDSSGVFENLISPFRLVSAHELLARQNAFDDHVTGSKATMPFPQNGAAK